MQHKRSHRVGELIHQEVSKMIQFELKDPRIGFVTVTGVEISSDIQHAKIYYTVMGDEAARVQTGRGLEKALPYIRRELGRRLHLRSVPELSFHFDASIEYGNRIESLLKEINAEAGDDPEDR